ncbi:hypothetical protein G7Y89_g13226 [Cudoniella acicularis]|uniref:Peroxisomal membrane protein PEX14 n=1 Tax=Cudoniella acicularis TaxID=354080 RepID=A0A8H4VW93_9HELO|nr:hypothetical protein G7Y89_g13226 [Cudoniella acicularis]
MSDSEQGEKKASTPSWQQKADDNTAKETEKPASEPENRAAVLEQARKFLEEEEVKDATTDKKIAFLETKGLKNEEIQELLGVSRNLEASSDASSASELKQQTLLPHNLNHPK